MHDSLNLWDPDLYAKAWKFATQAHAGQLYGSRVDNIPYNYHLSVVAQEVILAGVGVIDLDLDLAIQCALLHDAIEDTPVTYAVILECFGVEVAEGVRALTKRADLPKAEQLAECLLRIQAQPREIWIVKLADRIANISSVPDYWSHKTIQKYSQDSWSILDTLGEASPVLAARLVNKIALYQSFVKIN